MRAALLLIGLASCVGTSAPQGAQAPTGQDPAPHHRELFAARDALIAGDGQTAAKALSALRQRLPLSDLDAGRRRPTEAAIGQDLPSPSLQDAAAAVGRIGGACSTCHRARRPLPPETMAAPSSPERVPHAADGLWQALIEGRDSAFSGEAAALSSVSYLPDTRAAGGPAGVGLPPPVFRMQDEARAIATEARSATTPAARGRAYARLLTTCHPCHQAVAAE